MRIDRSLNCARTNSMRFFSPPDRSFQSMLFDSSTLPAKSRSRSVFFFFFSSLTFRQMLRFLGSRNGRRPWSSLAHIVRSQRYRARKGRTIRATCSSIFLPVPSCFAGSASCIHYISAISARNQIARIHAREQAADTRKYASRSPHASQFSKSALQSEHVRSFPPQADERASERACKRIPTESCARSTRLSSIGFWAPVGRPSARIQAREQVVLLSVLSPASILREQNPSASFGPPSLSPSVRLSHSMPIHPHDPPCNLNLFTGDKQRLNAG